MPPAPACWSWPTRGSASRSRGGRLLDELADLGGLEGADGRLVFGPELHASALDQERWRIVAYHPTVVLMQIDLLLPLGEKRAAPDPVRRLREAEHDGPDRRSGVDLLARLWWARRVVVEVPLARSVHEALGADWWRERRAIHDELRAAGIEVWAEPEPWPDALYTDGAHFTAEGGAALRRWLGARLAGA